MPVEFEEQEFNQPNRSAQRGGQSVVTNLIFRIGLAKTQTQANVVMLIIAVVAAGLAVYLLLPSRATVPAPVIPIGHQTIPGVGP